ncbi:MAG: hypothetical protein OXE50_14395 [Chloroflexi bacterium]|nr:hypothetical protein [Chloroflexota bacterium]
MKNLLITTAIIAGIGFGVQAGDPNHTLEQITEIVAGHYLEEIENLQESHANNVAWLEQTWIDELNYFSQDSGTGVEVTNVSGLVGSIVDHANQNHEDSFNYLHGKITTLEAENADLQAENDVIQEWANYEITVREAQLAEVDAAWHEAYTTLEADAISEDNPLTVTVDGNEFSWTSIENAQNELYDIIFDSLYTVSDEEFAEMQVLIHSALAEYDNGFANYAPPLPIYVAEGVVDRIHAIVAEYEAQLADLTAERNSWMDLAEQSQNAHAEAVIAIQWAIHDLFVETDAAIIPPPPPSTEFTIDWFETFYTRLVEDHNEELAAANAARNAAQAEAQEASNRANSNAANVAAWYEEAMRLQAEVDRLQEELDNQ